LSDTKHLPMSVIWNVSRERIVLEVAFRRSSGKTAGSAAAGRLSGEAVAAAAQFVWTAADSLQHADIASKVNLRFHPALCGARR